MTDPLELRQAFVAFCQHYDERADEELDSGLAIAAWKEAAVPILTLGMDPDEYRHLFPLRRDGETAAAFVRRLAIAGGRVLTAEAALKVSP